MTILILIFLSIIGSTLRIMYFKDPSTASAEFRAEPEEDRGISENIQSDKSGHYGILSVLDLTRIPTQTQTILSFLLLLPVGLLITALARSMVGIRTIGTFSPTLLALSQARSDWRIGIVIFVITFGLGSLCRMFLTRFKLSTMPRRGVIGTSVVLALVAAISISHRYGLSPTARHILLPVAVMTIMIERFFTMMEKEGNKTALTALVNSLATAVCCFVVFAHTRTGQFLLRFPELELLIIAGLILIGRYSGRSILDALGLLGNGSSGQNIAAS
jgi:hypothetical protein